MDGKKKCSAARKKLEEYKLRTHQQQVSSQTNSITVVGGATYKQLNETTVKKDTEFVPTSENHNILPLKEEREFLQTSLDHPPTQSIPEFLNNLGKDLQQMHGGSIVSSANEYKIMNIGNPSETYVTDQTLTTQFGDCLSGPNVSTMSTIFDSSKNDHLIFTPSAPTMPQFQDSQQLSHQQNFPVNFFQSTPITHGQQQYQSSSFNAQMNEDITSQTPLFYNVNGSSITPFKSDQTEFDSVAQLDKSEIITAPSELSYNSFIPVPHPESAKTDHEENVVDNEIDHPISVSDSIHVIPNPNSEFLPSSAVSSLFHTDNLNLKNSDQQQHDINYVEHSSSISIKKDPEIPEGLETLATASTEDDQFTTRMRIMSGEHLLREVPINRRTPTPTLRRSSASSQDEKDKLEIQTFQRMKSVQDALEMQLEELRRDNERLIQRQAELVSQVEDNEKHVQEIRRERDRCKEDAKKLVQPLNIKINNMYEENQRILKNSNEVGMELRTKLQEKSKLYEDMEQAFIIVSKSKMEIAAELDQEKEKCKELEYAIQTKDEEITNLRMHCGKLEEKFKVDQQRDSFIHQLEDQRRHYQVQSETLTKELEIANRKLRQSQPSSISNQNFAIDSTIEHTHGQSEREHNHDHTHSHDEHNDLHHHNTHEHDHHDHTHGHDHHAHGHDHTHQHDHDHLDGNACSHHHDGEHDDGQDSVHLVRPPTSEAEEMKKRLHHLEWENSTFRSDLDKLATEARDKKQLEEKLAKVVEDCDKYREECQRLELLIVQLEGENDTIGDYIALYQSQRLALKESAKEKDVQLENLAKERVMLLKKMEELTHLLRALKDTNASGGPLPHQCPGHDHEDHIHHGVTGNDGEIEGKIRNLLTEISSSSLIENFHPCAVCSGRLMNV